jgi:hypothetical protein
MVGNHGERDCARGGILRTPLTDNGCRSRRIFQPHGRAGARAPRARARCSTLCSIYCASVTNDNRRRYSNSLPGHYNRLVSLQTRATPGNARQPEFPIARRCRCPARPSLDTSAHAARLNPCDCGAPGGRNPRSCRRGRSVHTAEGTAARVADASSTAFAG